VLWAQRLRWETFVAFAFERDPMRTIVYVDGFNLYYLRLKGQPHFKWLNLKILAEQALGTGYQITTVNYYTARVSGRIDGNAPKRQQVYFAALQTIPEIAIHFGNFLISEKWAYLVRPPKTKPSNYISSQPLPDLVWVSKPEEKGSDVNLATHLVRDGLTNAFDVAVVITNDTDLCEPIRVVVHEVRKQVILLSPYAPNAPVNPATGKRLVASRSLQACSSSCRYIHNRHLRQAQFSDPIVLPNNSLISKPATWI
jgi:hypothetical protein